jgi:recombination protein RecT
MSDNKLVVKKDTIDLVEAKIKALSQSGELQFPANYVPQNALKSAWLVLQNTKDRAQRPVLESCTKDSIANSLLSMAVQGLNPDKKQCYFVAYGNQLTLMRSYFGAVHVAKTVNEELEDIYADVVYKGDTFKYEKKKGRTIVTQHEQELGNIKKNEIVAAYAVITYRDGREEAVIMTIDDIKQSWKQSIVKPVLENGAVKEDSTHGKFPVEMCKRTVINKAAKTIINTSDDRNIIVQFAKKVSDELQDAQVAEEIADNANREIIDIIPVFTVDPDEIIDPPSQDAALVSDPAPTSDDEDERGF